ncbi:PAS domain S-box protein [Bradyrhizobium sp. LHD-71]|uniref:PAS domain S-box protein n=1 Tax=Bradyrhizobium sp. LHD-71 TaxID=3072141 RepID=UPI0028100221|nr:PAS domain S-box protein [Bradyrhizobium sp. LHD-71]MDQ8729501.1 PAS domain S-box protein [Bradyrhizobium sp. LHD-71]
MTSPSGSASDPLRSLDAEELHQHLAELAHERDEAYRVLQEREAELALIQRIGRVGGVEVDLREGFRNRRRSPEYLIIHGLPPSAANETHQDWLNRIHPADRARAERQFLDAIGGTVEHYHAEYRIIRPSDGEVRWIGVTARIERDDEGRALRLVGAHIDITERMQAQESLRESEERFRQIANSAPVPMWVTKLDRTRAFANQAYLDFLGLPYDEAVVFDWRKALHPDDLARILKEQIAGESSLKPFVLEARYRRADGEWRWLRSESQPRFDPFGNHIGFIGLAHDITVAKQAETGLRQLNETLESRIRERTAQLETQQAQMLAILDTTHLYQTLLDLNGNVIHANKTALAGIGADASDVLGKPFWEMSWFTGTEAMPSFVRDAFGMVLRGESVREEVMLHLSIGDRFFDFAMRPVFDRHGKVSAALSEAVDITERRAAEEVLRQSQKMEAVGQLTGGVAHDFNNLLTIIRSATDFLRRRDLPEERHRRYINAITETVDRAAKLIGQLLAFARRQPLKPQVFNVGEQVESIAQLIRPLVGKGIEIKVGVEGGGYFAVADIGQFETAIINLAVNARDAMAGEGSLEIHVAKVLEIPPLRGQSRRAGEFVAVSVADTGTGIAAEKLDMIFEPFFTTKEVGKGTGLGLSQAFGFSKQSGGDVEVKSALGKGATFVIYLPQAVAPRRVRGNSAKSAEPAVSGRGYSVLVVEDNVEIGRVSTEVLHDLGYATAWVTDARAALAALESSEFDLVFSDIVMPGMNGVELAAIIRERRPNLPIVLTSGYSNVLAENAHHGFELIQKPYSIEVLSRALRNAIAARQP